MTLSVKIHLYWVAILVSLLAYAQQASEETKPLHNFGYLELGGRFVSGAGLQYERKIPIGKSFAFTTGVGVGTAYGITGEPPFWPVIVPVSGGVLIGKKRKVFEAGVSYLLVKREFYEPDGRTQWIPAMLYLGYRKLPIKPKGMFFKIDGLLYPVAFFGILPFVGVGLGYQF